MAFRKHEDGLARLCLSREAQPRGHYEGCDGKAKPFRTSAGGAATFSVQFGRVGHNQKCLSDAENSRVSGLRRASDHHRLR